jgi:hypothetical protein
MHLIQSEVWLRTDIIFLKNTSERGMSHYFDRFSSIRVFSVQKYKNGSIFTL